MKHKNKKIKLMKLSEYLKKNRISLSEFCEMCAIPRSTFSNLIYQGRNVSVDVCIRIEKTTKGKVKCLDLYEEYIKPHKTKE